MIRVRVLGAIELQIGHRRIGMNTELLFALALYLTTRAGERIEREELLATFWAKGTELQRRHALRQMLYRLRQKGMSLEEDGDRVCVDPARVDSDVRAALDASWVEKATAAEVDAAGGTLPAFSRRMPGAFLTWMDELRDRVSAQHRKASLRQITVARREGRWADLERWAQAVLRTDPLNEDATLARAESAAMAGSKTIALEILDEYLAEVGEISAELGKPALALRKRLAERRPDWTLRGPKEVPLVGRTELMSRLTGLVEAAWRGEGSAVVLVGAPGIGKTRLALEARAYAELKGMRTVVVRAEAGMSERPLALIQRIVAALLEVPGAAGCTPESFALLRRLLASTEDAAHGLVQDEGPQLVARLSCAVRELAAALASETRALIIIDDLHCGDSLSQELVRVAGRSSIGSRLSWIATSRPTEADTADRTIPEGAISRLRIPVLSEESATALALATCSAHGLTLPADRLESVVRRAAGNPLFTRDLSHASARDPNETRLPESLTALVSTRMGLLSRQQTRLLRAVALLGNAATVSRVSQLVDYSHRELSATIETLEHDGILGADESLTLRVHEVWRSTLLESFNTAARTALAHECARLLAQEHEAESDPHLMWRAAELFEWCGESRRSRQLYLQAADRLYHLGLPTKSIEVLERTKHLDGTAPERIRTHARLARAHLAAGNTERALQIADGAGSRRASVPEEYASDRVLLGCMHAEAAHQLSLDSRQQIADLLHLSADQTLPPHARQIACLFGARLTANASQLDLTRTFFDRSAALETVTGRNATTWLTSVVFLTETAPIDAIEAVNAELERLDLSGLSAFDICRLHRFRCHSLRIAGNVDAALDAGRTGYTIAADRDLRHDAVLMAQLLAFICLDAEDLAQAETWLAPESRPGLTSEYESRAVSLAHARDRLDLQQGRFEAVVERLGDRLDTVRRDGALRSRCGELATLANSLAHIGDSTRAGILADEVNSLVTPLVGTFSGDYPIELLARTYRLLERPEQADEVTKDHVRRELEIRRRAVPAFYAELNSTRRQILGDN